MATRTTRQTAQERRETLLEAAQVEFSQRGFHGASTDAIARAAGISQPYLFRLFGSKKELFLAVTERCLEQTLELFRAAAAGKTGYEALEAIGDAYVRTIVEDRTMLQGQLQAYAASVSDADVRETVVRGFGRLYDYVEAVSGGDQAKTARFFANGMLLNVMTAMQVAVGDEPSEAWARRLAEGFGKD
jgi:AcrR family transcriptional regulator